MVWWIAAALVWIVSAGCILCAMASVFRGQTKAFAPKALTLYSVHGVTAVLALWLAVKALGQQAP